MTDDYERGRKEGQVDALLDAHSEHLAKINGSIERFVQVGENLSIKIGELGSEVRAMREQAELSEERARVAAETLAAEAARRRGEMIDEANLRFRTFTKRERIVAGLISLGATLIGLYVATH